MIDSHPDPALLLDYANGRASDEVAAELERHLEECRDCEETLDNLDAGGGTLVGQLRQQQRDPILDEPQLASALARIAALPTAPGESEHPDEIAGYRILEPIGSGGMGTVYKALHPRLERIVALKTLPSDRLGDERAVARFDREMKAVGRLGHPHIVQPIDAGEADGVHYLVMEYVEGLDLADLSRALGPLPLAEACELVRQAALGLQEAHEAGLVHRDVKPGNLLLAEQRGTPPVVKVLDLGLALFSDLHDDAESGLTGTGQIMGTLDYMAPEQPGDTHGVDGRADVYALGATLYKLLSAKPVFHGEPYRTPMQKLAALASHEPPRIESLRPDIPIALADLVHRLLEKDPTDRPQSPAAVAAALEPFVAEADLTALLERAREAEESQPSAAPLSTFDGVSSALSDTDARRHDPAVPTAPYPTSQPQVDGPRRRTPLRRLLLLGGLAAAVLLAGVIVLNTGKGQLELTVNEPDVEVRVDGDLVHIESPRDTLVIDVTAGGAHEVQVTKNGFETFTSRFRVFRNGTEELTAVLKPRAEPARPVAPTVDPTSDPAPPTAAVADPNAWPLGPAKDVLPGLIPRPTKLPGVKRWQAESALPRSLIHTLDVSPNGKFVACGMDSGHVRILERQPDGLVLRRILMGHDAMVSGVDWHPDGDRLASGSADRTVRIWDRDGRTLAVHELDNGVRAVAWSPDGRQLAAFAEGLYVGDPGDSLRRWRGAGSCLAWSPDGKSIATGHNEGAVKTWSVNRQHSTLHGDLKAFVVAVEWSPDGTSFVTVDNKGGINRWDAQNSARTTLRESGAPLWDMAWSPNGEHYATIDDDSLVVWSKSGDAVRVVAGPFKNTHKCMTWLDDETLIASPGNTELITWNSQGHVLGRTPSIPQSAIIPTTIPESSDVLTLGRTLRRWSRDGECLLVAPHSGATASWSAKQGRVLVQGWGPGILMLDSDLDHPVGFATNARNPKWSPGGERVVIESYEHGVQLLSSNGTVLKTISGEWHAVTIQWSPDGRQFAVASRGRSGPVHLFDENGEPGPELLADGVHVGGLAWTPDSRHVAASFGERIHVWSREGGATKSWIVGPWHDALEWTSDGKRLLCACEDGHLRAYSSDGRRLFEVFPHLRSAKLATSGDGTRLLTSGYGSNLCSFDVATLEPQWTALLVDSHNAITFTAAGEVRFGDSKLVERSIVYVLETDDGRQYLLRPKEFNAFVASGEPFANFQSGHTSESNPDEVGQDMGPSGVSRPDVRPVPLPDGPAGEMFVLERKGESPAISVGVRFLPDGRLLSLRSFGRHAVWDLESRKIVRTFGPAIAHRGRGLTPDGTWLVIGPHENPAEIWHVPEGRLDRVHRVSKPTGHARHPIALDRTGNRVASLSKTAVEVHDRKSGELVAELETETAHVAALSFLRDGRLAVAGKSTVRVWDYTSTSGDTAETVEEIHVADHHYDVEQPAGTRFLVLGGGRLRRIDMEKWITEDGGPIEAYVTRVATTPDGRFVVTGHQDGEVAVWDIQRLRKIVSLGRHAEAIMSLDVSADGRFAASVGNGGESTRIWRLPRP